MMEETHHSVLSRFERTSNSLERILTIIYFYLFFYLFFKKIEGVISPSISLIAISLVQEEILPRLRDRWWDIALGDFVNN